MMFDKLITATMLTVSVILFTGVSAQIKNPSTLALESYQVALQLVQPPNHHP